MLANGGWDLIRAPTNASKWRMGFNSAFKGLTTEMCASCWFIYILQDDARCIQRQQSLLCWPPLNIALQIHRRYNT